MHLFLQELVVEWAQPPGWLDLGGVFNSGWPQSLVYCVWFRNLLWEIKLPNSSFSSSFLKRILTSANQLILSWYGIAHGSRWLKNSYQALHIHYISFKLYKKSRGGGVVLVLQVRRLKDKWFAWSRSKTSEAPSWVHVLVSLVLLTPKFSLLPGIMVSWLSYF